MRANFEFKPMPLAKRLELLKGMPDVLTQEHKQEQEFYSKLTCYRCGGKVIAVLNNRHTWTPNKHLPNTLAKCAECEVEYEPYTQIEVSSPKNLV